jgi:hypothetical protein
MRVKLIRAVLDDPAPAARRLRRILEKLGMRDRVELTRYAIRNGLVEA